MANLKHQNSNHIFVVCQVAALEKVRKVLRFCEAYKETLKYLLTTHFSEIKKMRGTAGNHRGCYCKLHCFTCDFIKPM